MAQDGSIERQIRETLGMTATEQTVATWLQPVIDGRIMSSSVKAIWALMAPCDSSSTPDHSQAVTDVLMRPPKRLARDVVQNVGGPDKVRSVTHCATRLRFILKDEKRTNMDAIKAIDGVLGCVYAADQMQVVMGKNLIPAYDAVIKNFHFAEEAAIDENLDDGEKQPLTWKTAGSKLIGYISGSVAALIPGLIAGGMLKVVLLLITLA